MHNLSLYFVFVSTLYKINTRLELDPSKKILVLLNSLSFMNLIPRDVSSNKKKKKKKKEKRKKWSLNVPRKRRYSLLRVFHSRPQLVESRFLRRVEEEEEDEKAGGWKLEG